MRRRLALAALVAAGMALGGARPARAFVRYVTASNAPYSWRPPCVGFIAYPDDMANMMTVDQILGAASGAAEAWSAPANDTSLMIQVASTTGPGPAAKYDQQNSLVFRESEWCRAADDATGACTYDPTALAITSVFATADGKIVDADIEINARYFRWGDLTQAPTTGPQIQDLQNALTHEMGHAIGLDHPCLLPGSTAMRSLDNLGNLEPDCDVATPDIQESTMFPSSAPGDISKRTLAVDDVLAVDTIYPPGPSSTACSAPVPTTFPDRSTGCALSDGGPRAHTGVLAAWAAILVWTARRRRR
jgi:hypothetical protein